MSHINFVDAGLQPLAYQHVPVETVAEKFSREDTVILFVLDLTMTDSELKRSTVIADLEALREIYGTRLQVIGTFADQFSEWTPLARKKRREIWSERIGSDWVEYSDVTKEGLLEIVRRILQAAGREASDLLPHLKAEKKVFLFQDLLHILFENIDSCMWWGIIDSDTSGDPYTDLKMRLPVLWVIYLDSQSIDIDDASWQKVKYKVAKTINHINFRLDRREERAISPYAIDMWWERLAYLYSKKVTYYQANVPAFVQIIVLFYGLLHESGSIESPRIADEDLEQWLADVTALMRVQHLEMEMETVWVKLFRRFHPSALPVDQPDEDGDEN